MAHSKRREPGELKRNIVVPWSPHSSLIIQYLAIYLYVVSSEYDFRVNIPKLFRRHVFQQS